MVNTLTDPGNCGPVNTTIAKQPSIERLDRRIVRGFAPTAEVENDPVGVRPQFDRRTDELGAIVAVDPLRQAPLEPEPLERRHDVTNGETVPGVDRQALAREQVQDGQRAEAPAIR